jgi:hypothetical protein
LKFRKLSHLNLLGYNFLHYNLISIILKKEVILILCLFIFKPKLDVNSQTRNRQRNENFSSNIESSSNKAGFHGIQSIVYMARHICQRQQVLLAHDDERWSFTHRDGYSLMVTRWQRV